MVSVAALTAGQVMDAVAALLNDSAKQQYSYTVQVPYLNIAIGEIREYLALNDVPLVNKKSAVIALPAGQTYIGFDTTPPQAELPDDFLEPVEVWQRNVGTTGFSPVGLVSMLSEVTDGISTSALLEYTWSNQRIQFQAANAALDIKLDYIAQTILPVASSSSLIDILLAQSFLQFRTAALIAENVEENESRATRNNIAAGLALDRILGISVKSGQGLVTRRRPFRSGYRTR